LLIFISSVTENNITLAVLGKQEENKNAEIQKENHGLGSTVLTGHLPNEWSPIGNLKFHMDE